MEQLFFILNNLLVLLISATIAFRLLKDSLELTLLGTAVLVPIVILLTSLLLGAFGILYNSAVTLFLLLLFLLISVKPLFQRLRSSLFSPSRFSLLILLFLCGALGGYLAGRFVFTGTHFVFDDFSYHAVAAGHWIQDHSLWSGPFNYHYHNPMNAEVLSCWWMLPFNQDGFAFLTGGYWLFLSCLCVFILCGRLNISLWIRILIPLILFISRHIYFQAASTFSAVDLAGPAMVLASLAFLSFQNDEKPQLASTLHIFSGLSCGFAVGSKVPFATVAVFLVLWILLNPFSKSRLRGRSKNAVLFCLGVFLTGFWWYGKNIYLTGNPVFPGQLGPWAGPLTSEIQFHTKIIGLLVDSGFSPKLIADLFCQHLNWPLSLGLLSLAGYAGAGLLAVFKKDIPKNTTRIIVLLLLSGVIMFATYINMPFSGRYNAPNAPMQLSLRFAIAPYLIGVVLYSLLMNLLGKMKWPFVFAFFVAVAAAQCQTGFMLTWIATATGVLLAIAAKKVNPEYFFTSKALIYAVILCAGAIPGLALTFSCQQKKTDNNLFRYRNGQFQIGLAWQQLDAFPQGITCTGLGPNSYLCYPLLGRRLQHAYRVLGETGQPRDRLYERYRDAQKETSWWGRKPKAIESPRTYLQNAAEAGVVCFLIARYEDGTWLIMPRDFIDAGWNCTWENNGLMIWKKGTLPFKLVL